MLLMVGWPPSCLGLPTQLGAAPARGASELFCTWELNAVTLPVLASDELQVYLIHLLVLLDLRMH